MGDLMFRLQNCAFSKHVWAVALFLVTLLAMLAMPAGAIAQQQSATASSNGVTFTVEWDDAVPAGQATTFHVSAVGGSNEAKARMDVPTYWWPTYGSGSNSESVCDPSRNEWANYCQLGEDGHDFSFEFTASGTYVIYFYFMDTTNGITYLRTKAVVSVNDDSRPSVSQIVDSTVSQARSATDGSEYQMALWLHDWVLDQVEYDRSYNWCSAESGLTRGKGTCESYQRIYQRLLTAAGITNARVEGNGHTWNAVKIDGAWCQVDPTWDDQNDEWYGFNMRHFYFGLTDELMAATHSDLASKYQASDYAYRSTDLRNSYYVRNGEAATWAAAYRDQIQAELDGGSRQFTIASKGLGSGSSYTEQIYNGNIAYALGQMSWSADGASVKLVVTSDEASFSFKVEHSGASAGSSSSIASSAKSITPKPVSTVKLKAKKKGFKVSWAKRTNGTSGFQIRYSASRRMRSAKTVTVKKATATSKAVKKLKKKKRYYVKVRAYKQIRGKTYYSTWSKVKTIKTK